MINQAEYNRYFSWLLIVQDVAKSLGKDTTLGSAINTLKIKLKEQQ